MGEDSECLSDAELLQVGRELSEAFAVSVRCSSCGAHGPLAMPDGLRHLIAKAFSVGYRMRELGREGCVAWMGGVGTRDPVDPGGLPVVDAEVDAEGGRRDRDERSERSCDRGLDDGRHVYQSANGRLWACPCGAWIVGTKVVFAWPGSPLDGQAHVVTDAELEELGSAGLVGVEAVLEDARTTSEAAERS